MCYRSYLHRHWEHNDRNKPRTIVTHTRGSGRAHCPRARETTQAALSQIRRIVYQCGAEQALAWLDAAQAREAAGGMIIKDGSRRRTPGGVYFAIVSAEIAPDLRTFVQPPPLL